MHIKCEWRVIVASIRKAVVQNIFEAVCDDCDEQEWATGGPLISTSRTGSLLYKTYLGLPSILFINTQVIRASTKLERLERPQYR
jgi:hypothetical protein